MLSSFLSKLSPSVLKNSFFSSPEESPSIGQSESLIIPKFDFAERIKQDNTAQNMIIWHDPNVNSEENETYCDILGGICEYKTFEDWKEAAKEIKQSTIQCHVLTSGTNGEELVKEISSLKQVAAVYVFCMNMEYHSKWAKRFSKVNLVDDVLENVLNKMNINMQKLFRQKSLLRASFPGFIFDDDEDEKVEKYLNLYIQGFTNPSNRSENEEEFLALARQVDENVSHCLLFKNSYKKYDRKVILQKYNEELYKIINSCLRIGKPEAVQPCQYILKDLELAIREESQLAEQNYSGLAYKGVFLSSDEWQELKDNIGKDIELYGFLLANKIEAGCDAFVKADNFYRAKITIIILDGGNFVDMKEFSWLENEDEFLFNVRSRFRVLNAEMQDIDGMKCRHLFLMYIGNSERLENSPTIEIRFPETFECDYCETMINMIQEDSLFYLNLNGSKLLCVSCKAKGEHNKHPLLIVTQSQLRFLENLNKEVGCLRIEGMIPENPQMINIPFYGYECSECKTTQFAKCYKCTVCQQPNKKWCEKCTTQKRECLSRMHLIVLEENPYTFLNEKKLNKLPYKGDEIAIKFWNDLKERTDDQDLIMMINESLGDIYESLSREKEAIQCYLEAVKVIPNKFAEIGCLESKVGKIYTKLGQHQDACDSRISALEKRMLAFKEIGGKHFQVVISNEEIGDSYCELGFKEIGKGFYEKALEIMKVLLSPKHKKFVDIYRKLGKLIEGELAAQYYEKAVEIQQYIFGDMDLELGIILNELASIYSSLDKFTLALTNYSKALKILNNGSDQLIIGDLYYNIGSMHYKLNDIKKAKENHDNALKQRLFLSNDEPNLDIANSYNSLGEISQAMGASNTAIEYLVKALEIRKSLLGENHLETTGSYFDIGEIYDALGDHEKSFEHHEKSFEYHKKALEIRRGLFQDENRVEIATSYGVVATLFFKLDNLEQSENHNWKALEIYKKIYEGEEHKDIASIYNNIAIIYYTRKKPQLAKQYFMKAGEIWSKVLGEKDSITINAYQSLITVLQDLGEDESAEIYTTLINN